jgi:hypothetical protein
MMEKEHKTIKCSDRGVLGGFSIEKEKLNVTKIHDKICHNVVVVYA